MESHKVLVMGTEKVGLHFTFSIDSGIIMPTKMDNKFIVSRQKYPRKLSN